MSKFLFLLCAAWLLAQPAGTQKNDSGAANETLKSYQRALQAVEDGLTAMGGRARIAQINDISFTLAGNLHARNQSLRPDAPYDKLPISNKVLIETKRDWVVVEQENEFPGGLRFANRVLLKADGGFGLNLSQKTSAPLPPNAPTRSLVYRWVPPLFLLRAYEQRATLRWAGAAKHDGRPHHLVTFFWNNTLSTLYLDAATKLLSKVEFILPDAWAGDDISEVRYTDYRAEEGVTLPHALTQWRTGRLQRDSTYTDFRFNTKPAEDAVKLPPNFPAAPNAPPSVRKLAADVYAAEGLAGGAYRALFIGFKDFVVVVEAPGNSQVSQFVIGKIKETYPDKPIKYLVLTHYHDDHTGGLRPYVAAGAQIVTAKGNQTFFEEMASARYTLAPDALAQQPKKPVFEFADKRHTISDGTRTLELHNIGPTPHVADMFVVYLPQEKMLYQADLYNLPGGGVTPTTVHFMQQMDKLGINVETLLGTHSNTVPFAQAKRETLALSALLD